MSDYLLSRLEADPAITIHYRTEMTACHGAEELEAVTIRDKSEGRDWQINTRAVFIMVGAAPNKRVRRSARPRPTRHLTQGSSRWAMCAPGP